MIETDVLIVGAGPAGLATAIALLRNAGEKKLRVVVLDKGRSVGGTRSSECSSARLRWQPSSRLES